MSRLVADPAATHPTSNRQPFRIVRWALRRGELPCVAFSVHIEYAVKGGACQLLEFEPTRSCLQWILRPPLGHSGKPTDRRCSTLSQDVLKHLSTDVGNLTMSLHATVQQDVLEYGGVAVQAVGEGRQHTKRELWNQEGDHGRWADWLQTLPRHTQLRTDNRTESCGWRGVALSCRVLRSARTSSSR